MQRLIRFPPWTRHAMVALGIAWIILGWAGGGGPWITVILVAAVWGAMVGRRVVHATVEPWSKERGIVIWAYRRKQKPSFEPTLVWTPAQTDATASRPTATPVTPASPTGSSTPYERPLPFPSRAEATGTPAPVEAAPTPSAATPTPEGIEHKTCPDCAESVLSAARVCRYCGYRF